MWVATHADNGASCPAGAVTAATQSWSIKIYMYQSSGQSSLLLMHGPYLKQNQPPYFPLLYHTAVYGVEVAVHAENDSA